MNRDTTTTRAAASPPAGLAALLTAGLAAAPAPLLATLLACGEPPDRAGAAGAGSGAAGTDPGATGAASAPIADDTSGRTPGASARVTDPRDRPASRTDTLRIEGMAEPLQLRLFQAPDDFALPFTAYVPVDLEPEVAGDRSVHFTAAFGGRRNEDAFLHVYVFAAGMDRQTALAAARAYKTGRGIPVSQGLEPIADDTAPARFDWAAEAYRFRYQSGGTWYAGTLGVGSHAGRHFMIVRHRPVEYGDGFAPRADVILQTWVWADGSRLQTASR